MHAVTTPNTIGSFRPRPAGCGDFPNTFWLSRHSTYHALTYVTEQLDAAGGYFVALFQATSGAPSDDWDLMADAAAYFFCVNAQGWRQFCDELKIDPEALAAANYQGWLLRYCEEQMPNHAPSCEALLARMKNNRASRDLVTAEEFAASWIRTLRAMTRHAPPPKE